MSNIKLCNESRRSYTHWIHGGSDPDATHILRLVTLDEHPELSPAVQVTAGPNTGADFVGIYTLDGDALDGLGNVHWELLDETSASVIESLEANWSCGTDSIDRADFEVMG